MENIQYMYSCDSDKVIIRDKEKEGYVSISFFDLERITQEMRVLHIKRNNERLGYI